MRPPVWQPPVLPARFALATIVQASRGVSDDAVVVACVMGRRWLWCWTAGTAPTRP